MKCEDLLQYLSDYIDQELDEELTAEAQEHLATCHNCRVVLDTTQQNPWYPWKPEESTENDIWFRRIIFWPDAVTPLP